MVEMIKKPLLAILNIPLVWNTFQTLVGANAFKAVMYPSVFEKREGKLLDFGCSCGNSTDAFLKFDYWGVDVDAPAIEAARKKFAKHSNVRFQTADLTAGPYKESFFDHILFAGTAHHVTPDQLKVITRNLISSLRPGGELHIFEPLRQKEKDSFITSQILNHDQGKYIRTKDELLAFFGNEGYEIAESKIFESPNRPIKLPDFLYMRIEKK